MNKQEVIKKLKSIIREYTEDELHDELNALTTEAVLKDALNIDSMDMVEIIVDIESSFGIVINNNEIVKIKSFNEIYDLIVSKLNK